MQPTRNAARVSLTIAEGYGRSEATFVNCVRIAGSYVEEWRTSAYVGASGFKRPGVPSGHTQYLYSPQGSYSVTESFGVYNPGTALPYRVVDGDDWWVSDVNSPRYNQYVRCARGTCGFDESAGENLYDVGAAYDYAVVMDYNRGGTTGAGSAFFLHVSNGAPTAGCVAVDAGMMRRILGWLDPGSRPLIATGVG